MISTFRPCGFASANENARVGRAAVPVVPTAFYAIPSPPASAKKNIDLSRVDVCAGAGSLQIDDLGLIQN